MALQLIINVDDAGKFSVSGPIGNKALCYQLLELARDSVYEYCKQNESLITPVSMAPPKFPGLS